ncbi:3,4-dihydroxy-2-butanone-4-phosphate synthase [Mycetocola zhujimingii]|uniref:Multifunctional fusion protein n=1 Tax=Mycetocola zhujimingii TaxID=2079792 RepID=A0A2U1TF63_9MICO|nr:3,4-dihydroxy-2-butanone-4-phosphate synthase [Mycetocola zhujimingii]PWC07522.1 bifunctional 3,4-dihydroxy-2-butanone-4-phosphate synthase/GTP cyclohydrolase II [Mycetocola zhujimingii]
MSLATIPQALRALREGKPVLVADDEGRENEGDIILSAELATRDWVAWTVRHSSGYICAPMSNELADRLELPIMVAASQDIRRTAYTITVDAAEHVTTGISAADRATTLRVLGNPGALATDLIRPGHIVPLRAVDGGVRERAGHTEAAVELMKLAGLSPVGAICEVIDENGDMMRLPGLIELGLEHDLPVITIAALIDFVTDHEADSHPSEELAPVAPSSPVLFEVETNVPTTHGTFRMRAYRDRNTGADHVAIIAGDPKPGALVRVHSECLTGEAFGSLKCECGPQLDAALDTIRRHDGVVVYLRGHEGRGIGLINKLRAYQLQEEGLDTLDANLALGLPGDARSYQAASAILQDLGLTEIRLLTNNPEKARQLEEFGIAVTERVPLVVGVGALNESYLQTKRDRMGHEYTPTQIMAEGQEAGTRS